MLTYEPIVGQNHLTQSLFYNEVLVLPLAAHILKYNEVLNILHNLLTTESEKQNVVWVQNNYVPP